MNRMRRFIYISVLLALPFLDAVEASTTPVTGATSRSTEAEPLPVVSFRLSDLRAGLRDADFSTALRTTGLIAILPEDDVEFSQVRGFGLEGICQCWSRDVEDNAGFRAVEGSDSVLLKDGHCHNGKDSLTSSKLSGYYLWERFDRNVGFFTRSCCCRVGNLHHSL
jgi:hypothetical protein